MLGMFGNGGVLGRMMVGMLRNHGDACGDDGGDDLERGEPLGALWRGCFETGGMLGRMMVGMFWNRWDAWGNDGEDVLQQEDEGGNVLQGVDFLGG